MPRYRLLLEYDGGCFCGWQSQAMPLPQERAAQTRISVQDTLIRAVEDFCGERVAVAGAGRTDSGVHALGQVAHFDLERQVDGLRLREALNFHLREAGVVVLEAGEAVADFHARFDATARRYIYRICNRRASPIIDRGRVWHVRKPLDAGAMDAAAKRLLGQHDFTTFRSTRCQAKSAVKTLDRLDVVREDCELRIYGRARSFLYHQMRSMVGALKLVGEGKWTGEDIARALEARSRSACPTIAPAAGLYLEAVEYD